MSISGLLFALLAVFLIVRRARRHIGPQPVEELRILLRLGWLVFCGVCIIASASAEAYGVAAFGFVVGVSLSVVGLSLTRWEGRGIDRRYIPNSWIGLGLTTLLLGRLAYRLLFADPSAAVSVATLNPATLALILLLFGYNFGYQTGVLWKARQYL